MAVETDRTEREKAITLDYLCGNSYKSIPQRWNVPVKDARQVVEQTSRGWNDPLIEFYRQTPQRDRLRNAVHFYLSYSKQGEGLPNAELVEQSHNISLHDIQSLIIDLVIDPLEKGLIKETQLDRIVKDRGPLSPEQKLLYAVFGNDGGYQRAIGIVAPIINQKLKEAYMEGGKIDIKKIYDSARDEVYAMLKRGLRPSVQESAIQLESQDRQAFSQALSVKTEEALQKLKPKEADILKRRFGIGYEPHTWEQVAEAWNYRGTSSPRQIEAKALRKLRHPLRSKYIRVFLNS
ncbi:hypothetical protein HYV80_01090 [Candidatus Woesearchaeota archaeon]|nr:hypothetical protein [Candidatus Woesearchaeota archaeon]